MQGLRAALGMGWHGGGGGDGGVLQKGLRRQALFGSIQGMCGGGEGVRVSVYAVDFSRI